VWAADAASRSVKNGMAVVDALLPSKVEDRAELWVAADADTYLVVGR